MLGLSSFLLARLIMIVILECMKTLVASLAIASFAAVLAGCAQEQLTSTPTVFVDSSFSPEQVEGITAGFSAWEDVTTLHFNVMMADHAFVASQRDTYLAPNVIFVLNDDGIGCRNNARHSPTGGVTDTTLNGSSVTCYSAKTVRTEWMASLSAHEAGHALRLEHLTQSDTIMTPEINPAVPRPTMDDAVRLSAVRGMDVTKR